MTTAAVSGCATREGVALSAGVGTVALAGGVVGAVVDDRGYNVVGYAMLATAGGSMLIGSLINWIVISPREDSRASSRDRDHARAAELYTQATQAAAGHDCSVVREVEAKICEIDRPFHDSVVMRDPTIAVCFDTGNPPCGQP